LSSGNDRLLCPLSSPSPWLLQLLRPSSYSQAMEASLVQDILDLEVSLAVLESMVLESMVLH